MLFSKKKGRKDEGRRRSVNKSGVYDVINAIMGLCIILSTFVIFIDRVKYEKMFTAVFLFASTMNTCMGIKYLKRQERLKAIVLILAGIFLMAVTVLTFFAFW